MNSLMEEVKEYVFNYFSAHYNGTYVYHNYTHTQQVAEHVQNIALAEEVTAEEVEILEIAAWFHDIGFHLDPQDHEAASAKLATEFLTRKNFAQSKIQKVEACILATKPEHKPQNLEEQIIIDANYYHLGLDNYPNYADLIKEESKMLGGESYSEIDWEQENLRFLTEKTQYYTHYAVTKWQAQKALNITEINKNYSKLKVKGNKKKKKKDTDKNGRSERGIDTLFRITLRNHTALSDIADRKANILLSVNAIIISVALSNLIPKLDNPSNNYLIYPTILFITFSVVSMILSIIATRPNITTGTFTKDEVINKKVNIVFFGKFHKMKLDDFEWAMDEVMNDKAYLYSSLTKDLYALGTVLARKYKILRFTYVFFMVGMVISIIAFGIAFRVTR